MTDSTSQRDREGASGVVAAGRGCSAPLLATEMEPLKIGARLLDTYEIDSVVQSADHFIVYSASALGGVRYRIVEYPQHVGARLHILGLVAGQSGRSSGLFPALETSFSLGNKTYTVDRHVEWDRAFFEEATSSVSLVDSLGAFLSSLVEMHAAGWSVAQLIRSGVYRRADGSARIGRSGLLRPIGYPIDELPEYLTDSELSSLPAVCGPFLDLLALVRELWPVLAADLSWQEMWIAANAVRDQRKRRDVFFKSLALSVPVIEWPPLGEVLSDFLSNPGIWTARDLLERITANPPPCQVQTSVVSHRGTSRSNNEDCALANEYQVWIEGMPVRAHLLVVADGMGGQGAGEVASRIATQTVDVALHKYINDGGLVLGASNVRNAIELANSEVYEARMGGIGSSDMGTTLSVALLIGRRYYIGVVGDSRVYSISSEGDLCLLSYDHSMAGELYRAGSISFEEADEHPMSSKLTRSIGAKVDVEVDLFSGELKSNEGVLLTTDGFNRAIREFTFPIGSDLDEALDALIVRMLKRDGSDNATAVIVRVG